MYGFVFDGVAHLNLNSHLVNAAVVLGHALRHLLFLLQNHAKVEHLREDLEEREEMQIVLCVGTVGDRLVDVTIGLGDTALASDALHVLSDPSLVHLAGLNVSEGFLQSSRVLPECVLSVDLGLGVALDKGGQRFQEEAGDEIGLGLLVVGQGVLECWVSDAVDLLVHLVGELSLDFFDVVQLRLIDLILLFQRLHLLGHFVVLVFLTLIAGRKLKWDIINKVLLTSWQILARPLASFSTD